MAPRAAAALFRPCAAVPGVTTMAVSAQGREQDGWWLLPNHSLCSGDGKLPWDLLAYTEQSDISQPSCWNCRPESSAPYIGHLQQDRNADVSDQKQPAHQRSKAPFRRVLGLLRDRRYSGSNEAISYRTASLIQGATCYLTVSYIIFPAAEGWGTLKDAHTVEVKLMPDGGTRTLTGKFILIATGGHAVKAPIEGAVRSLGLSCMDLNLIALIRCGGVIGKPGCSHGERGVWGVRRWGSSNRLCANQAAVRPTTNTVCQCLKTLPL